MMEGQDNQKEWLAMRYNQGRYDAGLKIGVRSKNNECADLYDIYNNS